MKKHLIFIVTCVLIGVFVAACQKQQQDFIFIEIQDSRSPLLKTINCKNRLSSTNQWYWTFSSISQGEKTVNASVATGYEFTKCSFTGKYTSPHSDILTSIIIGLNKYSQPVSLDQSAADFTDFSGKETTISLPFITEHKLFKKCLQDGEFLSCNVVINYDYEKLYMRVTADLRIPTQEIESLVGDLLVQLNKDIESK